MLILDPHTHASHTLVASHFETMAASIDFFLGSY